jgi:hypothetical protein
MTETQIGGHLRRQGIDRSIAGKSKNVVVSLFSAHSIASTRP